MNLGIAQIILSESIVLKSNLLASSDAIDDLPAPAIPISDIDELTYYLLSSRYLDITVSVLSKFLREVFVANKI